MIKKINKKSTIKNLFVVFLPSIILIFICLFPIIYRVLLNFDASKCYLDDAKFYQVEPTYEAIRSAIFMDVKQKVRKGMNYDDVIQIIRKFRNFHIVRDDKFESLNRSIKVEVRTCFFSQNNFNVYFFFENENIFSNIYTD